MATKTNFYRTYLIRIRTPKGVFFYGGQHLSRQYDYKEDNYLGSGTILHHFKKKYGKESCKIKWFKDVRTVEEVDELEIDLISKLKNKHATFCLNITDGGRGGKGYYWNEEQKILHKILLNSPVVKENMRRAQKEAQNRPSRKIRQSEIMTDFYSDISSRKIISELTSKAQRVALHWKMPLKKDIYDIWINLGMPKQGEVVKALKGIYPCTGSSIKLLIYEFRDKGFIEPL